MMVEKCDAELQAIEAFRIIFPEALSELQSQWRTDFRAEPSRAKKMKIYRRAQALLNRPYMLTPTAMVGGDMVIVVGEA